MRIRDVAFLLVGMLTGELIVGALLLWVVFIK